MLAMLDSLLAAILAALFAPKPAKVVGVGAMLVRLTPEELLLMSFLGLFLALAGGSEAPPSTRVAFRAVPRIDPLPAGVGGVMKEVRRVDLEER